MVGVVMEEEETEGGGDNDEAMKVHVVGGELLGKDGGGLAHDQDSFHSHSTLNSRRTIEDGLARRFACAPVAEENEGGNEGSGGGFVTTREQTREVEISSEVDECQQADEMPSAAVTVLCRRKFFLVLRWGLAGHICSLGLNCPHLAKTTSPK